MTDGIIQKVLNPERFDKIEIYDIYYCDIRDCLELFTKLKQELIEKIKQLELFERDRIALIGDKQE